MAENHVTLQEAIEIVSQLDLDDRLKLRHALDRMTGGSTDEEPETNFKRVLLEKGTISEIRSPRKVAGAANRRPVPVKGKPVSETIIEDRG
ncbi:MAG: hypothetical protein AABN34_23565 [Acidobacteriota bacterium]